MSLCVTDLAMTAPAGSRAVNLARGGMYELTFSGDARSRWSVLSVDDSLGRREQIAVPALPGVSYLLRARAATTIAAASEAVELNEAPLSKRLKLQLRLLRGVKERNRIRSELMTFYPQGEGVAAFYNHQRHMAGLRRMFPAFAPDDPELYLGFRPRRPTQSALGGPRRIAVAIHLHFHVLWPEFEAMLSRWTLPFDLFVTVSSGDASALRREVASAFPQAKVIDVPNSGRDVRPFLALLEEGAFDGYDVVCKLHGKRSSTGGRCELVGDLWRRGLLAGLASPAHAAEVLERFEAMPNLGLVGSRCFRLPNASFDELACWGPNRAPADDLAREIGLGVANRRLDFFGGTMFWIRPAAMAPLRALRLSERFSTDRGALDGQLEHVLERLVPAAVRQAGFAVEDI